jgi:hypothetical protein
VDRAIKPTRLTMLDVDLNFQEFNGIFAKGFTPQPDVPLNEIPIEQMVFHTSDVTRKFRTIGITNLADLISAMLYRHCVPETITHDTSAILNRIQIMFDYAYFFTSAIYKDDKLFFPFPLPANMLVDGYEHGESQTVDDIPLEKTKLFDYIDDATSLTRGGIKSCGHLIAYAYNNFNFSLDPYDPDVAMGITFFMGMFKEFLQAKHIKHRLPTRLVVHEPIISMPSNGTRQYIVSNDYVEPLEHICYMARDFNRDILVQVAMDSGDRIRKRFGESIFQSVEDEGLYVNGRSIPLYVNSDTPNVLVVVIQSQTLSSETNKTSSSLYLLNSTLSPDEVSGEIKRYPATNSQKMSPQLIGESVRSLDTSGFVSHLKKATEFPYGIMNVLPVVAPIATLSHAELVQWTNTASRIVTQLVNRELIE